MYVCALVHVCVSLPLQEAEQFSGFELERIVHTHPCVVDCETDTPLAGFALKAYDVTHLVSNPPKPGTRREKKPGSPTRKSR